MEKFYLNLQMFADPETMLNSTGSESIGNDLSHTMKTYYDRELLDVASPALVHDQFGIKKDIPAGNGKKIEFRQFKKLPKATEPLTEGVTPVGGKLDMRKVEAKIEQYGYYIVQTDVLQLTALDDTILAATQRLGTQAGETLDTVVRDILHANANKRFVDKVSNNTHTKISSRGSLDGDCLLTVNEVLKVAAQFAATNIKPIGDSYVAIIHPFVKFDLMNDPKWEEWSKYTSPDKMYNGEVGRIGKVRFVESSEAKINYGKDLASDSRTLDVNGAINSATTTVTFDGASVAKDALAGRWININGVRALVKSNTTAVITLEASTNFGSVSDNAKIYPGEGGKAGVPVFGTLFIGQGAYGVTEVTGGGLEMIVKQAGSSGVNDALNQRSSIGWKAMRTAEILDEFAIICLESCASTDEVTEAN